MSETATSLYVNVADRAWVERRPGVHWKTLWEGGGPPRGRWSSPA